MVDHDSDEELCAIEEKAADAISAAITGGPKACAQVGALLPVN